MTRPGRGAVRPPSYPGAETAASAASAKMVDVGVIPGSLFPNAERVRAVRDGILAIAPPAGVPLTDEQAVAIADLFEGDIAVLLFMRDHPGHWICLSGNAMGDGPVPVDKSLWHSRLVEAADEHHAFWARLSETTPRSSW